MRLILLFPALLVLAPPALASHQELTHLAPSTLALLNWHRTSEGVEPVEYYDHPSAYGLAWDLGSDAPLPDGSLYRDLIEDTGADSVAILVAAVAKPDLTECELVEDLQQFFLSLDEYRATIFEDRFTHVAIGLHHDDDDIVWAVWIFFANPEVSDIYNAGLNGEDDCGFVTATAVPGASLGEVKNADR